MIIDEQLKLIFERLDRIEKNLCEIRNNGCVGVDEFEELQDTVARVSPIAIHHKRSKCNIIGQ